MTTYLIPQSQFESAARSLINAYRSTHTRQAYSHDLEEWLNFCRQIDVAPETPTLDAAAAFREQITGRTSANTARRVLAALSSIYRKLFSARIVAGNPFHPAVLSWPPGDDFGKTAAVSDQDAQAMITCASENFRDHALLRLLYDTGIRRSSAVQIARAALQMRGGILTVRVIVKGGREVEIELPQQTADAIRSWLAVAPLSLYLFPAARGKDRPLSAGGVNAIVAIYAEKAGVSGKIHPHSFRAAFVTAAYDAGLHEREIQAAVHHADPQTTRKYDRGVRGGRVAEAIAEKRRGGNK